MTALFNEHNLVKLKIIELLLAAYTLHDEIFILQEKLVIIMLILDAILTIFFLSSILLNWWFHFNILDVLISLMVRKFLFHEDIINLILVLVMSIVKFPSLISSSLLYLSHKLPFKVLIKSSYILPLIIVIFLRDLIYMF